MKRIVWTWAEDRFDDGNGSVNITQKFLVIGLVRFSWWRFDFERWAYDGLPRRTICIGPLRVDWGQDHYWTESGEDDDQ